jgi:hypothetical protein
MKKLSIILILIGIRLYPVLAQSPVIVMRSVATFLDAQNHHDEAYDTPAGVVIIDGDELGVIVSPNPASTQITFSGSKVSSAKSITISSSVGKVVLNGKFTSPTVDVKSFANGTYYYTLTDDTSKVIAQGSFVVQH